jgi:hypothetical protein
MNFKIDDKEYDSEKLSDNGKLYLSRLENINVKRNQLTMDLADLNVLQNHYVELLKKELPKQESKKKQDSNKES